MVERVEPFFFLNREWTVNRVGSPKLHFLSFEKIIGKELCTRPYTRAGLMVRGHRDLGTSRGTQTMVVNGATFPKPERHQAFVAFLRTHENELRSFVRSRVGSEDVTQDIVQGTFLLAWTNAKFDPRHPYARAWAFTAARRLILDRWRAKESNSISLDDLSARAERESSRGSQSAVPVDHKTRDPLGAMIEAERNRKLDLALSLLSDEERDVLERYYFRREGTQHDIARALDISIAAFNSRLNRARKQLKRLILKVRGHDGESLNGHDSRNG